MPRYAPELAESVIHQYLHTDKPVGSIARDHAINERDVTRIRHAAGLPPRGAARPRSPAGDAAVAGNNARLKAAAPPPDDVGRNTATREAERIAPDDAGGAMRCAYCALRAHSEPLPVLRRVRHRAHRAAGRAGARRPGSDTRTARRARARADRRGALRAHALHPHPDAAALLRLRAGALPNKDHTMTTTTFPQTSMSSVASLRAALTRSSQAGLTEEMLTRDPGAAAVDDGSTATSSRSRIAHQEPPAAANNGGPWTTWLVLGGRGAGKTRLGAEWVRALALGTAALCASAATRRIALVGETEHDVREVMIEGASGLLRVSPRARAPAVDRRRGGGSNGRTARSRRRSRPRTRRACAGRSSTPPGATSSPNGATRDDAFDMLQFGLRLGARPRQLITTTPRPIALIKRLIADPRTAVTRAATHANAAHLSPAFLDRGGRRATPARGSAARRF